MKEFKIPVRYEGDIRRFIGFCEERGRDVNVKAMIDYLEFSLDEQRVKKTTWERRYAAIKKYLEEVFDVDFRVAYEAADEFKRIRKIYRKEKNADLIKLEGQLAVDKSEILKDIDALPVREKAICYVNLITANRPSDMVRMKVSDFELDRNFVRVYIPKQKRWHNKRLTSEAVKAVRVYFETYQLAGSDYFIGRVNKSGKYTSAQISEGGYSKALKRWIGLTAYNLRKTQITEMHKSGADVSTISKQTGIMHLETIHEHYLTVDDSTIDKYL